MTTPSTPSPSTQDTETAAPMPAADTETRSVFVIGLRNAHAMENQALAIMRPQLDRTDDYPEVAQRLQQHIAETENQIRRLEQILDWLGEDRSALKDAAMSVIGSMAAMGHAAADDAILKDTFADYAFEHYEMAAYKSLITIGRTVGANNALPLLQENLDEETAMADWLDQHIEPVTLKYLSLRQVGEQAKH